MHPMKIFLWMVGVPFVVIQTYCIGSPNIGFIEMYGFWNALPEYFRLHKGNGLLLSGLTDFMTIFLISAVWMISETPRDRRKSHRFIIWLASYIFLPGLGFLVYFLYLNPDHRFVSNDRKNMNTVL